MRVVLLMTSNNYGMLLWFEIIKELGLPTQESSFHRRNWRRVVADMDYYWKHGDSGKPDFGFLQMLNSLIINGEKETSQYHLHFAGENIWCSSVFTVYRWFMWKTWFRVSNSSHFRWLSWLASGKLDAVAEHKIRGWKSKKKNGQYKVTVIGVNQLMVLCLLQVSMVRLICSFP